MLERGFPVLGAEQKLVGGVIRAADGRFVAWSLSARLGDYLSIQEAENAVRLAALAKKTKARR